MKNQYQINLIKQLLDIANPGLKSKTENLSFDRGYLMGLLAEIIAEDKILERRLIRYIRQKLN